MRKLLFGVLLLLPIASAYADNGFYVGAGVSQARLDDVGGDFDTGDLNDFKIHDTAWKLIAGARLLSFLGAEANYMDLGSERRTSGAQAFDADAKAYAAYVVAYLPVPFVDVYAKFGAARWTLDGTLEGPVNARFDDHGTDVAYGAGAQVKFGSIAARLEYERFDMSHTDGVKLLTLGATYTFL